MAIVPSKRSDDRSLAQRGGHSFSHLRNQINRVFDDFWGESWLAPSREMPARFWPQVDITETEKEIKVSADIPGVEAQDIDVSVEDGMLSKGEKKYEREEKEKGQYRMERSYGSFERAIELPAEVDESKAKAEFKQGVLRLTLPKRPGAPSRRKKIAVM